MLTERRLFVINVAYASGESIIRIRISGKALVIQSTDDLKVIRLSVLELRGCQTGHSYCTATGKILGTSEDELLRNDLFSLITNERVFYVYMEQYIIFN